MTLFWLSQANTHTHYTHTHIHLFICVKVKGFNFFALLWISFLRGWDYAHLPFFPLELQVNTLHATSVSGQDQFTWVRFPSLHRQVNKIHDTKIFRETVLPRTTLSTTYSRCALQLYI